jgi:hypothetical protein
MWGKRFVVWLLLAGLATGCLSSSRERDDWYRLPPAEHGGASNWPAVDEALLHEVVDEKQEAAQALLADVALVAISEEQAAAYIGQPLPDAPGTAPYLVRGLYSNPATGRFAAFQQGDQLLVHHGSLGRGSARLGRRALVLQLEREPSEVYVYATTAR